MKIFILLSLFLIVLMLVLVACTKAPATSSAVATQTTSDNTPDNTPSPTPAITSDSTFDNTYEQISQETAKYLMDTEKDYIILDVRTKQEYDMEHIENALLIPDYEITERAEAELPDKNALILVYCRSGNRSKVASQALADMGYTNVKEFGGIITWEYGTVK